MPFFLIPVAVVGYKMWERRMREEKEREEEKQRASGTPEEAGEHAEELIPLSTQHSLGSDATSVSEIPMSEMELLFPTDRAHTPDDLKQESGPKASTLDLCADKENLVLGNHGKDALPLTKIST